MERFDLDRILIELAGSTSVKGNWTARHAVEGVQIFGGIGSGKTSGSGKMIALKYLEAGFGGLVLTVKPDEAALWQQYCELAGRENDLVIVGAGAGHYFNFLDYESKQSAANALTGNLVDVLKTVIRASADKEGGANEGFGESALDMLIYNVIDLCKLAGKDVSVSRMYELVQSLPTSQNNKGGDKFREMYKLARQNVQKQIEDWQAKQDIFEQQKHPDLYQQKQYADVPDSRIMEYVDQFFCESLLNLAEKTRSIIDFSFSGFLFRLLREPVYSLFCANPTNFIPEDCLNGKVIILNLPVKIYQKAGRDCQIMFKYIWQRAMERRDITKNDRPVFLWADEAQNFLHEHDADYQATPEAAALPPCIYRRTCRTITPIWAAGRGRITRSKAFSAH